MYAKDLKCEVEGCTKKQWAKGHCGTHYRRLKRHGDPNFINPKCNRDGNYIKRARANTAQWKKDNKIIYNAYLANRKARVKQATLKGTDLRELELFYLNCPDGYHVDHIEPLNGKDICGLHVIWNLQYLTVEQNLKKGNKRQN